MTSPQDRKQSRGYILLEAMVSLTILSIGVFSMQSALRQAIIVRGASRDYTQARLLLEHLAAGKEVELEVVESKQSGSFPGELSRFRWELAVSKVEVPLPPRRPDRDGEGWDEPILRHYYLGRLTATVRWTRGGRSYSESVETLFSPDKLYVPSEEEQT